MTISANTLSLLMDAGLEGDELMAIVRSIEADTAPKAKSANAERQARFRARQKAGSVTNNVTSNVTEPLQVTPLACVSDKPIKTDTNLNKKTPSSDAAAFKSALAEIDGERLNALIAIRKAKKAPLTGYAARLFIKAAGDCNLTVSQAVDTCIERNWLTVKLDWLVKPSARGSPARQPATGTHHFTNLAEGMTDEPERTFGSYQGNRDDAGGVSILTIEDYRRHG